LSTSKNYAVVLTAQGVQELGELIAAWSKTNDMGCYINAKAVEPNGPFVTMTLESFYPDNKRR
jgi:hypothetical protein